METAEVIGSGGVKLHLRESGPVDGPPIVFIHGWSQSWLSWKYQLAGDLRDEFRLIALDLRGHGMSQVPPRDEDYNVAQVWADDIAAIIDQRQLHRPVLVGWSFGGYVICDYIRAYGESALGGVNFVGWAVMMGNTDRERALAGPGFENYFADSTSEDLPTSIAAMRGFVRACLASEISADDLEEMLCYNILVPPFVRSAVALRGQLDNSELLSTLTIPMLVSQGDQDQVTRLAAADHILGCNPSARKSVYEGVGHLPFLESADRFNRELADFVRSATAVTPPRTEPPTPSALSPRR